MNLTKATITYFFFLVLLISFVSADDVGEAASTNADFYTGSINITTQSDSMTNTNNNGIPDTLHIRLTTNAINPATYTVIVDLENGNDLISESVTKTFSQNDNTATLSFSSLLFAQNQFDYTIRMYDEDHNLVLRKQRSITNNYPTYETGTSITAITDAKVNNNLRLALSLDVRKSETADITAFLKYDDKTIAKTVEATLSLGTQTVNIDFDSEAIKETHHAGRFVVDTVLIGEKSISPNYTTSFYNYKDFAETSYLDSFTSSKADANSNNLADYLAIGITAEIKQEDSYTVSYALYDLFDNFITTVEKTQSLGIGAQQIQTQIEGSIIQEAKINGPYIIKSITLEREGAIEDTLFNAHTTEAYFFDDFETPALPDLTINLTLSHNNATNITQYNLTITNEGDAAAFNVFYDLFDNHEVSVTGSVDILDVNESLLFIYNFTAPENAVTTAIIDFGNNVEENNESNNIEQIAPPLDNLAIPDSVRREVRRNIAYHAFLTIDEQYDNVEVNLFWATDDNLDLMLISPNGTLYDNESIQEGFIFEGEHPETITLKNPEQGTWLVRVFSNNALETVPFTVEARSYPDGIPDLEVSGAYLAYVPV